MMKIFMLAILWNHSLFADFGAVVCKGGDSQALAVASLNKVLTSQSSSHSFETLDSDGSKRIFKSKDFKSVSSVTIIEDYYGFKYGACVSIIGKSSKEF
jgi:hypothetical protein